MRTTLRPAPRLLFLLGGMLAVSIPLSLAATLLPGVAAASRALWALTFVTLVVASVHDARSASRLESPECERLIRASLPLGELTEVTVTVHASELRGQALVTDHLPPSFRSDELPIPLTLPDEGWVKVSYRARPLERGEQRFGPLELTAASPWRLFERTFRIDLAAETRVLPNFVPVVRYALLSLENRVGDLGIRLQRRRGTGLEFQELRDFVEGDSLRQVDWPATSRRQKLISRQFQDEKDQHVVFLLDRGRRMHARDGELTHFDHALNSVLLLSYVALRDGDSVGLMSFPESERWLPPQKGVAAMSRVLATIYDLDTTNVSPDYLESARRILTLHRRRALVVLISNLRDEDSAELVPALRLLRRRHLVVFASLREAAIEATLRGDPDVDYEEALLRAATHHYLEARQQAHDAVKGCGALTVDVEPAELPLALVNRYFEVKRSRAL